MLQRYNPDVIRRLYVDEMIPWAECCRRVGWDRRKAERVRKLLVRERKGAVAAPAPSQERVVRETGDSRVYTGVSNKEIRSLDDLLKFFGVDDSVWAVQTWECGTWEMGYKDKSTQQAHSLPLYKIHAKFKRKSLLVAVRHEIQSMLADAAAGMPKRPPVIIRDCAMRADCTLAEVSIYDHHLGKLCWGQETGDDYDLKIASEQYMEAVQRLLDRAAGYHIDRFVFVLGNDYLNSDNYANTTTRGTPQAMDGRYPKVFEASRRLSVTAIDLMLERAPVDVVMVPGNHDFQSVYVLGDSLSSWYRNCAEVTIDNTPTSRKYYEWGSSLLGFVHGDKQKPADLPLQMATDCKEAWGRTQYREFHTGHWHSTRAYEYKGVVVRALSSLCGVDAWHHESGYTHNLRSAEAFLWDRAEGLVGTVKHTLKPQ